MCAYVCPCVSLAAAQIVILAFSYFTCQTIIGLNKVSPFFCTCSVPTPFKAAVGSYPTKHTTPLQSPTVTTEYFFYLFPSGKIRGTVWKRLLISSVTVLGKKSNCSSALNWLHSIFTMLFHMCIMQMWGTLLNHVQMHHFVMHIDTLKHVAALCVVSLGPLWSIIHHIFHYGLVYRVLLARLTTSSDLWHLSKGKTTEAMFLQ